MVVIGERSALAWVLSAERMAFPTYRAREVAALDREVLAKVELRD